MITIAQNRIAQRATLEHDLRRAKTLADSARARVEWLQKQLDSYSYPNEPAEDGAVLTFAVRFKNRGPLSAGDFGWLPTLYRFAAIRAAGRWFVTGAKCPTRGYSWREFCDWLNDDDKLIVEPFAVMKVSNRRTAELIEGIE